jgi:hypothetical protein
MPRKSKTNPTREKLAISEYLVCVGTGTCCICGIECEGDSFTPSNIDSLLPDTVEYLHRMGWREGTSKADQVIGLMCGECFKKPDSER